MQSCTYATVKGCISEQKIWPQSFKYSLTIIRIRQFICFSKLKLNQSVIFLYRCPKTDADSSVEAAYALCEKVDDKGLKAETLLHEAGLFDEMEGIKKGLWARELCQQSYGEFSVLMARIYYNMAIELEWMSGKKPLAYQCFRRNWLIYRQITGIHHPLTKKVTTPSTVSQRYLYFISFFLKRSPI